MLCGRIFTVRPFSSGKSALAAKGGSAVWTAAGYRIYWQPVSSGSDWADQSVDIGLVI